MRAQRAHPRPTANCNPWLERWRKCCKHLPHSFAPINKALEVDVERGFA